MKKITLFFVALMATTLMTGQINLSHSLDVATIESGVACGSSGAATAQNNWFRAYDFFDFPEVTSDFEITQIEFGVGQVDFGDTAAIIINVYTSDALFPTGELTLVGGAITTVSADDVGTLVVVDLNSPAVVPVDAIVVVELIALDDDIVAFRIGQNELGETGVSYLQSEDCSIIVPTPITEIGFDDNIILNIIGDNVDLGTNDNLAAVTSIFPNPASDVLNVSFPSNVEVLNSSLYNVLGQETGVRLVNGTMNVSDLEKGVYILNVKTTAGSLTQKIVKQ